MCGITGVISHNSSQYIELMNKEIKHRGPDSDATYLSGNLALGHTRLSIQDLSENGSQPMFSSDNNYVIVFNGEIYNHWEIRKDLESKYDFKSSSDTETLLYGYIEYGQDILNKLNGIFAFALFDVKKRELFLARDHYGVKPLYFYNENGLIAFSSEMKAITKIEEIDKELTYKGIVNYINFLWSPGEVTPFKHVKKILPGHYLKINVDEKSVEDHKYYQIPFNGEILFSEEDGTVELLNKKLIDAVKRQLLADVEIGFFLSGGLDSSLLVAIAVKYLPYKPKCFTVKTENESEGFSSDLYYARLVAKHLGVELIEVPIEVDIVEEFDKMIYHLDEPQADPAPLNVLKICEKARELGVKVLIGGTAGDDLFSGYRRHQALKIEKYFDLIPLPLKHFVKWSLSKMDSKNPTFRRAKKLVEGIDLKGVDRRANYFSWIPLKQNKSLLSEQNIAKIEGYNPNDFLVDRLNDIHLEKNKLNQMLYWEMISFLVDHNLNYTDKMSMAVGVEVRVPFLDRDLVDFSTKISPKLKMKNNETKYILKKVAEKYLPKDVIYRSKTGFGAPVRTWILNDLSSFVENRLSKESINKFEIFNFSEVAEMIKKNKKGEIDASYTIWSLIAIDSWFRQFVKK